MSDKKHDDYEIFFDDEELNGKVKITFTVDLEDFVNGNVFGMPKKPTQKIIVKHASKNEPDMVDEWNGIVNSYHKYKEKYGNILDRYKDAKRTHSISASTSESNTGSKNIYRNMIDSKLNHMKNMYNDNKIINVPKTNQYIGGINLKY